ncbi:MAG: serine O-acetyltransferase [Nitrospinae bacterium]|nr:serine O-acetyltransferase [Nitrospinota bacterium]
MGGLLGSFGRGFESIRKDIAAVMERDPACRSRIEVILCYPGFHAVCLHRMAHYFWKRGFLLLARWLSHWNRFITGIEIHPGAQIAEGLFIDHGMGVVIGETTQIGKNCTIYQGVTLGGVSLKKEKRHPSLEDNVVVGVGARVLGPHVIGAGSRIGASSVVISDVPPGCTVVGVPARIVYREGQGKTDDLLPVSFEHHELPDPVEAAIQALNQRIAALEKELAQTQEPAQEK